MTASHVAGGVKIEAGTGDLALNSDDKIQLDAKGDIEIESDSKIFLTVGASSPYQIEMNQTRNIINSGQIDTDFVVNTDDFKGTFFVDGNDNTIIMGHELFNLVDSGPPSPISAAANVSGYGNDVKIMLSGSAMSRGTSIRGVTLATGDLVVSGGLYTGRLSSIEDSNSYLDVASNTVEIGAGHTVQVQIKQGEVTPGADVNFFVSGSTNSINTTQRGTAVFGGDMVVSGALLSKKLIDVKRFCMPLNNSSLVMFLANPNRTAGTTVNINDHTNMLMPFSGSLIKMTMDVQSACTIGISLHKAQDETALSHFTASFANNEIKEFNIKKGLTGSYSTGPHSPPAALEFSGSYAFDPGEQLALGFQKKSGSTPGTANINLIFEYDVVSKTITD